jgi:hypothetical protein
MSDLDETLKNSGFSDPVDLMLLKRALPSIGDANLREYVASGALSSRDDIATLLLVEGFLGSLKKKNPDAVTGIHDLMEEDPDIEKIVEHCAQALTTTYTPKQIKKLKKRAEKAAVRQITKTQLATVRKRMGMLPTYSFGQFFRRMLVGGLVLVGATFWFNYSMYTSNVGLIELGKSHKAYVDTHKRELQGVDVGKLLADAVLEIELPSRHPTEIVYNSENIKRLELLTAVKVNVSSEDSSLVSKVLDAKLESYDRFIEDVGADRPTAILALYRKGALLNGYKTHFSSERKGIDMMIESLKKGAKYHNYANTKDLLTISRALYTHYTEIKLKEGDPNSKVREFIFGVAEKHAGTHLGDVALRLSAAIYSGGTDVPKDDGYFEDMTYELKQYGLSGILLDGAKNKKEHAETLKKLRTTATSRGYAFAVIYRDAVKDFDEILQSGSPKEKLAKAEMYINIGAVSHHYGGIHSDILIKAAHLYRDLKMFEHSNGLYEYVHIVDPHKEVDKFLVWETVVKAKRSLGMLDENGK